MLSSYSARSRLNRSQSFVPQRRTARWAVRLKISLKAEAQKVSKKANITWTQRWCSRLMFKYSSFLAAQRPPIAASGIIIRQYTRIQTKKKSHRLAEVVPDAVLMIVLRYLTKVTKTSPFIVES